MAALDIEDAASTDQTRAQRLQNALPLWLPGLHKTLLPPMCKLQQGNTKYAPLSLQQPAASTCQQCSSHSEQCTQGQSPDGSSSSCSCCAAARRAAAAGRCRPQLGWVVAAFFLACPLLATWVLPGSSIGQGAMLAALGATGYAILTLRRWEGEAPYVRRFLLWFAAMVAELLFENCMVWLVAASDVHKYEDPPGLQDNLELAATWLSGRSRVLHWLLHVEWATTAHFLAAVLALVAGVAWEQHPYSGFGVMARFCATITLTRLARTAAFTTTVLPSPRPGCYRTRFPAVPDSAWGLLRVGVGQLRGAGGCNDLVFSGHGSFWTMAPLVYGAFYPGRPALTALLWGVLVQASVRNVLLHNHYSLDHFLAPLVTAAVWTWMSWVYPVTAVTPVTSPGDGVGEAAAKDMEAGLEQQDRQLQRLQVVAKAGVVVGLAAAVIVIFVAHA